MATRGYTLGLLSVLTVTVSLGCGARYGDPITGGIDASAPEAAPPPDAVPTRPDASGPAETGTTACPLDVETGSACGAANLAKCLRTNVCVACDTAMYTKYPEQRCVCQTSGKWLCDVFVDCFGAGPGVYLDPACTVPSWDGGAQPDSGPAPDGSVPQPPNGQEFLFEAGFLNYAWGFRADGIYVTAAGEVYRYSYEAAPTSTVNYVIKAEMTEADISAKYESNRQLLTTLSRSDLLALYAKVTDAEAGALLTQQSCDDAGTRSYVAFRYDVTTQKYRPIWLGSEGDVSIKNTAPAGQELVGWMRTLGGFSTTPTCKFTVTANCTANPTQCESVNACLVCAPKSTPCVVGSPANDLHCTAVHSQTEPLAETCDRVGDQICAGGKSWCKGDGQIGFRCERPE